MDFHQNQAPIRLEIWRPWEAHSNDNVEQCKYFKVKHLFYSKYIGCDTNFIKYPGIPMDFHQNQAPVRLEIWRPWEAHSHDNVEQHKYFIHGRNLEPCKECDAIFTRRDNLTRHMKMKHWNLAFPAKCRCTFCGKKFSRKDATERHMAFCFKNPTRPASLEMYMLTIRQQPKRITQCQNVKNNRFL